MTLDELAAAVADACDAERVPFMLTGALATGLYGSARSTADVDVVIDVADPTALRRTANRLAPVARFDPQIQFDTLTFGSRLVGTTRDTPPLMIELFALFDDPFVQEQFARRRERLIATIGRKVHVPTPEDIVVQKIRWARGKDLDDARDILALRGGGSLDMPYIRSWCERHGTIQRLDSLLAALPPE
jgi:hypothetical protein